MKIEYRPANTIGSRFKEDTKSTIEFTDKGIKLIEKGTAIKFEFKAGPDIDENLVHDYFKEKYFDSSFFPKRDIYGARVRYNSYKMFNDKNQNKERIGHYNLVICDIYGKQVQSIFLKTESKAAEILQAFENWIIK